MKRNLKNVDLIAVDCISHYDAIAAIHYCQRFFEFGKSILITDQDIETYDIELHLVEKLNLHQYSDFMLSLRNHTDNDFVMIVQSDGHIVNSEMWNDEYLNYDYIGAPWPNEESWIACQHAEQQNLMRTIFPYNRVGNGGFSIRSKKFLEFSSQYDSCEGIGEDSFLCVTKYQDALDYGISFAPFELAAEFSYENPCQEFGNFWNDRVYFDRTKHFGWHGKNFLNTAELLNLKYE